MFCSRLPSGSVLRQQGGTCPLGHCGGSRHREAVTFPPEEIFKRTLPLENAFGYFYRFIKVTNKTLQRKLRQKRGATSRFHLAVTRLRLVRSQSPQNKKQKLQQSRLVTKKLQKRMAKGRLQEKRVKTAWLSGKVLINHHKK